MKKTIILIPVFVLLAIAVNATTDDARVYYSLNDSDLSGSNPIDVSGYIQFNGTTNGGVTTGIAGVLAEGFDFDGNANTYVRVAADASGLFASTTQARSICMWFNTDSVAIRHLFKEDDDVGRVDLRFDGALLEWTDRSGILTTPVATGKWYHTCATYNTSLIALYVNGSIIGTNTSIAALQTSNKGIYLGANGFDLTTENYDGDMDEVAIYNRTLGADEIAELYSGFNPYIVQSGDQVNLSTSNPVNDTGFGTNSQPMSFNLTMNASAAVSCRLIINGTENESKSYSAANNIAVNFSKSLTTGFWQYNISCNTSVTEENTGLITILVDPADPTITWTLPSDTNATVTAGNFTPSIGLSDDNLYSYYYNLSQNGIVLFNYSNTTLTGLNSHTITDSSDLSNLSGTINATCKVCDGHTKNEILPFEVIKTEDRLQFDNTYVKSLTASTKADYQKLRDRYIFSFEYDKARTSIEIEVPEECKYVPNSGYKGHFVCEKEGKWIDFEGDYEVEVNGNLVTVTSSTPLKVWEFNSIGELNCVTETVEFQVLNTTVTFTSNILESTAQTFILVVNKGASTNISSATLNYNNTAYSANVSATSATQTNFTALVGIPITWTTNNTRNVTVQFNWTYQANSSTINLTNNNQTIFRMYLDLCTHSTNQTLQVNFLNWTDDTYVIVDYEVTFELFYRNQDLFHNYSFSVNDTNNVTFCKYPAWADYITDSSMIYVNTGDTYTYNTNNLSLLNSTTTLSLYTVDGTTQVTFTVTDQDDEPLEDVIIQILAYDTGTGSYDVVEIPITDYLGVAIANIVLNTQPYKFLLYQNGVLIFESSNTFVTSTSRTFRVNLRDDYYVNYGISRGILSSLTFNNATLTFTYTYSDPTSSIHIGCLRVTRRSVNGDTLVNETCTSSAASSILITIPSDVGTNTYIAQGSVMFDDEIITNTLARTFDRTWVMFGEDGVFATFLLSVALVTVGIFSPIVSIMLLIVVFIFTNIMGLMHLNTIHLYTFIILGLITIFKLARSE